MRKLDDIPKKSVFKVPEDYFDQLPTRIQARMTSERHTQPSGAFGLAMKIALPAIALVVAGIFWFKAGGNGEPFQGKFDEIDTDQIALYLESAERVDTEEVFESMEWTGPELDELQDAVYSNMENLDEDLLEEFDLDNL